ncbi:YqjF family protein [Arthrobacter sp. CAL618]|uniref:YqjF family protein n=1 Tax=Arthrobacter sp. CAL618 TaxID=1055770 RepID=UPI00046397C7|nr:DUF2071 domain-containing protein [Arthrobacter sp. CAL618]
MSDSVVWPAAPPLLSLPIMDQAWMDAVFLHWRIPVATAAQFMPPGTEPDVYDGDAWVGLIGFRMVGAGIGSGMPIPYFGSFSEINVRLYSRDSEGTRGVVFLTLDASRLAVVLVARAAGIPYVWSRCAPVPDPGLAGYTVQRFRGGATSSFAVRPNRSVVATDPLTINLTARFGLHSELAGRTLFIPNTHAPWPLHPATVEYLDDGLVSAAGIEVTGPPESVLYSPGVQTQFGKPRVIRRG